ncbi:hypothetical protein FGG08_004102 [Glutinoglossum americanum]|uniref:Ribosomal protein L9 domain-containing protein n=1 Tax=Glutinoglossum americanum TaxID=1670608 RepID=A0A9P8IC10_9PEZI|nr:hypothetical protein FGG08_004102 [Glutinoglossum americanum]
MAYPLRAFRAPECSSCMRLLLVGESWSTRPLQQRVRGKKKLAKDVDMRLKVRLLIDVPKYGRKGSIIPLPRGLMRNDWYPRGKAEYVTRAQLKELDLKDSTIERDVMFMVPKPNESQEGDGRNFDIKLSLLTPQCTAQILSDTVPPTLNFYRSPIVSVSQSRRASPHPRVAVSSAAADLAAASEPLPVPEPVGIYGSVSTVDVVASIRGLLAADEEGSRVVISPEDIIFTNSLKEDEPSDADRVKHLGDFEVEIRVKGVRVPLKKIVRVLAEDEELNTKLEEAGGR